MKLIQTIKSWDVERNFGNARDVRNILDKAVDTHAVHVKEGIDENARFYILGSDL